MINDRSTAAGIAGVIGAFAQNIYGITVKGLGITDRTFVDFTSIVTFYQPVHGVLGYIAGLLAQIVFGIMLGAIFSYLVMKTSSRYYLFKSISYGAIVWFTSMSIGTMANLPLFKQVPPWPALTTLIGALVFSLVMAYSLKILDRKTDIV